MEILGRSLLNRKHSLTLLLAGLFSFLMVNLSLQALPDTAYESYKSRDDLTACLDAFFDQLDEQPALADHADSLMGLVWRQPLSPEERLSYYFLQINLAYHLLQSGQIQASTHWYEQAYAFYQQPVNKPLRREMFIEEYVGKPLGNNYTRMGDFSKAVYIQQSMIASATQQGRMQLLPSLYANFATTHFYMQHYDTVLQLTDRGRQVLGQRRDPIAILLFNLNTSVWLERGQADSAAYWNARALQIGKDENGWYVNALKDKARILSQQGRQSDALRFLKQAWILSSDAPPRQAARIANEIADAFQQQQATDSSIRWYHRSLDFFRRDTAGRYPDFTVTSAMFGLAAAYEFLNQEDSCSNWYLQAVLNDYYTQQLIGVSDFVDNSIYTNESQTEKAITWHHLRYLSTGADKYLWRALWITELSKGRKLLYEQQRTRRWLQNEQLLTDQFESLRNDYLLLAQQPDAASQDQIRQRIRARQFQLSLSEHQFGRLLQAPVFTRFQSGLGQLSAHQTLISYFSAGDRLYRIVVDSSGIHQWTDSSGLLAGVHAFTSQYFYQGPGAFANDPGSYYANAFQLRKQLLPALQTGQSLIIAPSGSLFQLPFEALTAASDQSDFIGQFHPLNYQYTLLSLLDSLPSSPVEGIDVYSLEQSHLGFPALPFARREAALLQDDFGASYRKAEATADSSFMASLNSDRIVHVATHAVAGDSTTPAFILLQQKLLLSQIRYFTATCPLVVLAACETGTGTYQQHEGPLSLGRALLSKGVGGVLSARWQVADGATSEMMRYFYQALLTHPRPARALQEARLAYLGQHQGAAEKNPWYWAGLFYQGGDQQLQLDSSHGTLPYLAVLGVLLLLTALFAGRKYFFHNIRNKKKNPMNR